MRIVTWNLNGGGRQKVPVAVERLHPDVLIAAECADPLTFPLTLDPAPTSSAYIGEPGEKGLSCMGFGAHHVRLATDLYDEHLVRIAPIEVTGPEPCHLLAVWADNSNRKCRPAITALDHYRDWLTTPTAVVAGDFNEGPQWDRPGALGW